jgi:glycosyltransferase involved in cell wall biosynthesis
MNRPTITVITPIYNTGIFVIKALESVKRQTFRDYEHIIIDDCSTDNSIEIVERWIKENNYPCTFLKNEVNKGVCKTLNTGIRIAKGKYIKGIGDDEWAETFLEERIKHFEQCDDKVGITFSDMVFIDEESKVIAESYYEMRGIKIGDELKTLTYPAILNNKKGLIGPSAMIKKSVYEDVGLFDENIIHEGYDMWFRIAQKYKFAYFPKPLILYRSRKKSMSNSSIYRNRFIIDWLVVYTKHLDVLPQLSNRIKQRYKQFAVNNYYRNKDIKSNWFLISFKLNKDFKSLFFLCLCLLKIRPDSTLKIKKTLGLKR